MSQADPRRLGVHAAISVPGEPDEIPPEYVLRDADDGECGVRAKVAAAAQRGGFVLLVGESSVGKTRSAFEAVTALLPDWWLVHPAGPGEVTALAAAPAPRTVVWLDELQCYLDGEHGVASGAIRALLNAPDPVVIIGTIWPGWYTAYTTLPGPAADLHTRERQVLDLADIVRLGPEFSEAEEDRARAAAARDPRLLVALQTAGYGLTQTLAAAPQLVARWENAEPYARAVLTAALDAARLGARAPLSLGFLSAAAPGYCTSQQQAEALQDWFEQALAYATGKVHGAAAALNPTGAGMGRVAGYAVADYLIQYASWERRYVRVPASTWDAISSHVRDSADIARLAGSARSRLLYCYAIPLYRHAADAGDADAAAELAGLLADQGDADGLRALADAGDANAAFHLAGLLAGRGDADELRARTDAGDADAAGRLAGLLADQGDVDGVRALADAGAVGAAARLAGLLADQGDADGLRALADAGQPDAAQLLAELPVNLLCKRGDVDALRALADAGDWHAAWRLVDLLIIRSDVDELRARAHAGDPIAAARLPKLLIERSGLDDARARADAGDPIAGRLVAVQVDVEELRTRADAGSCHAAEHLAALLVARGDLDELRTRADAADPCAANALVDALIKQGRGEEAERLRRFGLNPDGSIPGP